MVLHTNPTTRSSFRWAILSLIAGLFVVVLGILGVSNGCGRDGRWPLTPVEGIVTKCGKPLSGVRVMFLPDVDAGTAGPRSTAFTDENGHYELHTDANELGAVVGCHRVYIEQSPDLPEKAKAKGDKAKDGTVVLREVEVWLGPQVLDFDLSAPEPR